MRFSIIRRSLVACAASLLLACQTPTVRDSLSLIDLDKEWSTLYQKKLDAKDDPAAAAAINKQLAGLSERAEQGGDDAARDADPATAAAFYRIAATTAWTAGPPRNADVLSLRDKGTDVCTKLTADPTSQPRDCAFIRVAPDLATLDVQIAEVKALSDASSPDLNKAERVANAMNQSIQRVLRERPAFAAQAESFDQYIQGSLNGAYCMLEGLAGLPSSSPSGQIDRIVASSTAAEAALEAARISTQCAPQ